MNMMRKMTQHSQDKSLGSSKCPLSTTETASDPQAVWYAQTIEPDLEASVSHGISSSFCDARVFAKQEDHGPPTSQLKNDSNLDGCVADDSQTEDNDLYLSDCRILLSGFDASDMRKLVNMVRRGGGSRYMSFSEKLTHIIVGTPSEIETRQIRNLAALGVIFVVKSEWLEDCDREKKEVSVLKRHIAYDLLVPKGITVMNQGKSSVQPVFPDDHPLESYPGPAMSLEKRKEGEDGMKSEISLAKTGNHAKKQESCALRRKGDIKTPKDSTHVTDNRKSSNVFEGKLFCFSGSFPDNQRGEIIEWVNQGGGKVVENQVGANVQFIVESHGAVPLETDVSTKYVSSHWIRSCLMDGFLLDVRSHILYSPLPCEVPFSGFENFCFCVSQYDEKERLLLRNLCFILQVKFVEKLTKKVTHLLCKFTNGPKYEAACKWGIQPVRCEWIYECVKQNEVVAPGPFSPKEVTSQDREAGVCTMTQYPTQALRMISEDDASQLPSEFQNAEANSVTRKHAAKLDAKYSGGCNKKSRISVADNICYLSSESSPTRSIHRISPLENHTTKTPGDLVVPDVAAAIEDLLEQTSKISDQKSPEGSGCDKNLFTNCNILGQDHGDPQSTLALHKHWINGFDKKDDVCKPSGVATTSIYDSFSETQTESQVVGYAEDLSGRQMILDRVRTRSSMT